MTSIPRDIPEPLASENNVSTDAIALLSAFLATDAQYYQPYFEYSEQAKIVSIDIYAVGNESTTARYTDEVDAWKQVNNILKISTADGYESISGVDSYHQSSFSEQHFLALQSVASELVALQTLDPVEVRALLLQTRPDLSDEVRASIDIALWDLAARKAGIGLHQLLGSQRRSIETYASLPFYNTLPDYIAAVNEYAKLGFKIFKFHVWGKITKDAELIALITQTFSGTPYKFMIDFESVYNVDEVLKLAAMMDPGMFLSLEAPIDDRLLAQYAQLKSTLTLAVIPAGYTIYSAEFLRQAIEKNAWDAARFDLTVVGGISPALELMMIADSAALPVDVQSWGHSLSQAANLHLMLANERCRYFEAPMPMAAFEFAMKNPKILKQGRVVAPAGLGLGIEVDWHQLGTADFYRSSKHSAALPADRGQNTA